MKNDTLKKDFFDEKGVYSFYVNFICNTLLSAEETKIYSLVKHFYNACFLLSRENKLDEAAFNYEKGKEVYESAPVDLQPWLEVFCRPHISYYYYKIKDYPKSVALTNGIIESARMLSAKGYQYLFFVEVQQMHNLSRIYFATGELQRAIQLCVKCLKAIVDHSLCWSPGMLINGMKEERLIEITQKEMLLQIVLETYNRMLRLFKDAVPELRKQMKAFVDPVVKLDFETISADTDYVMWNGFFSLTKNVLDYEMEVLDKKGLLFVENNRMDKELLQVLLSLISLMQEEIERSESAIAACV